MSPRPVPAVYALLLFAAVLLALPPDDALAQTPKRGGILRLADREAPNLDPHLSVSFLTHSSIDAPLRF